MGYLASRRLGRDLSRWDTYVVQTSYSFPLGRTDFSPDRMPHSVLPALLTLRSARTGQRTAETGLLSH